MLGRAATTFLIVAALAAITACNTVRGAGQDLQSASNAVENAIN